MRARRRLSIAITSVAVGLAGIGLTAPAATSAAPLQYVTLGDSYSAGNGSGDYTETTCWRSPQTYGARVAARDGAQHANAACSGGVVADILNPRTIGTATTATATYEVAGNERVRQDKWLREARSQALCGTTTQPDFSYDMTITASSTAGKALTATVSCQLTIAPQIDSVDQDTDAVFLTVGGNDIGFSNIVAMCLVLRNAAGCQGTIAQANAKVPAMVEATQQALRAVRERSRGNAEIYLVGYPNLINTDSYSIPEVAPTYDAGAGLHAMQARGDELQSAGMAALDAQATGPHGYTFVDVKPAWGGMAHGLDPHVTPDNSAAWLVPALAPGRQVPEWVHPTPEGYAATATAVIGAMR